jgi:glycosyltransferase involved in cell wall biosynthesis
VSEKNIQLALQLGIGQSDQYTLIRSGVDIQQIKKQAETADLKALKQNLHISAETKVVLTVGPFKIQKDPLAFVRVAHKVLQTNPEVQFFMVGDGELKETTQNFIRFLKIEDQVHILGWRRNIPELMQLSDCLIMTSLWEGLPRAVLEALILGKPVVAFAVDGIPEVVQDGKNGFLLAPGQEASMAKRIIEILNNPALLFSLSAHAKTTIDNAFDIHQMVRDQEKLYLEINRKINNNLE